MIGVLCLAAAVAWHWSSLGALPAGGLPEAGPTPAEAAADLRKAARRPALPPASASLKDQVAGRTSWPLPAGLQLPGITQSTLAESLDEWLASLPPDQRERARAFAMRYPANYAFDSAEQQAWMLQHGYPSLEEVVAFDAGSMTARCDRVSCDNAKIAALAADEALNRFEESLLQWHGVTELPADPMQGLDAEQQGALLRHLVDAKGYAGRAREQGALFFAAQLNARERRLTGDPQGAEASEALLRACGDPRIAVSDAAYLSTVAVLSNLPGSPCGISPARPAFPGY